MNQTFDIHRFVTMIKLDMAERGKNYLGLAALLAVSLLFMLVPIALYREQNGLREALHYMALFMIVLFGSSLYTSSALSQYSASSTGISALMVPASRLEKFLSSLLFNLIFIVTFLTFFTQLHYLTIDIANANMINPNYQYTYINIDYLRYLAYFYFIMHSVVFLGSIYFPKSSYVKTASLFLLTCLFLFVLHVVLVNNFTSYPDKTQTLPWAGWRVWNFHIEGVTVFQQDTEFYHVEFPYGIYILMQVFAVLLAVGFWAVAYLQLKEKQL